MKKKTNNQTEKTFETDLKAIKDFLSDKRQLTALAERSDVKIRTVHEAFLAKSFDALTGKKLTVYQEAIKMVDEIKKLPAMASAILNAE